MAQSFFTSGAGPTAEAWEARRLWITQLYLEEDKPLKDVMAIVNVGGFRGSPEMYKDRITAWRIDKKIKDHEARAIVHLHAQRSGKPSQTYLRGRPVDIGKIESHFKRKRISIEDVLHAQSVPPSDIDLMCRTPSPVAGPVASRAIISTRPRFPRTSPVNFAPYGSRVVAAGSLLRRVEAPDGLKIVELIFADIYEFVTKDQLQTSGEARSDLFNSTIRERCST